MKTMTKKPTPSPTPASIGVVIQNARFRCRLSQVALSKRLGISNSHLCLIEQGKRGLTVDLIAKLAKVLKLRPAALITAEQAKESKAWRAVQ